MGLEEAMAQGANHAVSGGLALACGLVVMHQHTDT